MGIDNMIIHKRIGTYRLHTKKPGKVIKSDLPLAAAERLKSHRPTGLLISDSAGHGHIHIHAHEA